MVRTQIQLSERQASELRNLAHARGISLAEVIRRFVDQGLAAETQDMDAKYARAARVVGRWRDPEGRSDLAENHDHYLDEAYS